MAKTPSVHTAVNRALRAAGRDERLVKGRGYYYFWGGDAASWPSSSVYVSHADVLSVEEWLAEHADFARRGAR
jgi:hypothetical protein